MIHTLICTVGNSLLTNLSQQSEKDTEFPELQEAYTSHDWKKLAKALLKIDPASHRCGVEINTISEISKRKNVTLENLVFLVSDTPGGKISGSILENYFKQRSDLPLRNIGHDVVEKLQHENPKDFKIHGLRNLVRKMTEYISKYGGSSEVAIEATGGYKAQIALSVIIGQVLNIPVFYKYENFPEIISFPPLPISLDYQLIAYNAPLLTDLERGKTFSRSECEILDEKIRFFLDEVEIDGEVLFALNPIGQIYLSGFRKDNPKPLQLVNAENRKEPTFRSDHYPIGFQEFVHKVWRENKWIVTINSLPYDRQASIRGIGFRVEMEASGKHRLIGTYEDKDNFGARYWVHLTDETNQALRWAAGQLNQKYRPN